SSDVCSSDLARRAGGEVWWDALFGALSDRFPCPPVRRPALELLAWERGCGTRMKSLVDARPAAELSRCPSRPILQNLADLPLGENLERPIACSRHGLHAWGNSPTVE